MKILRSLFSVLLFFLFFMVVNCARVLVKPGLTFGPSEDEWVKKCLRNMTLEEKIGQMVVCDYSGHFINRDSEEFKRLESLIIKEKIGGLILFGGGVYETAFLTNTIQKLAKIPLLIASDLERGLGSQISGATLFPPLMSIGATNSEDYAYLMGKITAVEARALGVHMTYAPVVDVNINPENPIINTRSFGEDPENVSRLAVSFIKGCQENGLIATAKHFPGHGDTDLDSHSVLPTIGGDRSRLEKVELHPFKQVIKAGVRAIMTAHLRMPALDSTPELPATLSSIILTDLLRKELEFKGLIVTDAMTMGGITSLFSPEEAALKAVEAGADMILLSPDPYGVIKNLIEAVKNSQISESRINYSVKKILEIKAALGIHKKRLVNVDTLDEVVASEDHLRYASLMFEHALTLVKNEGKVLPLQDSGQKIAVFSLSSDPGGYFSGRTFIKKMKVRCPDLNSFYADAFTGQEFIDEAVEKAEGADVIVIALFSRLRSDKGSVDLEKRHAQLVRDLVDSDVPVVVISFGSPYFINHFPCIHSYLCAYRYADEAQEAAVKALFGEIDIGGRLPVSIPGLYPAGHGLIVPKKEKGVGSFF